MVDLCGQPLIDWTLEATRLWPVPVNVVVATDDSAIANRGKAYGAEIIGLTKDDLEDRRTGSELWKSVAADRDGVHILMENTAPFRLREDLIAGWEMFESGKFDLVRGVLKIRFWLFDAAGRPEVPLKETTVLSQHRQPRFHPTGSFYIANSDYLRRCENINEGRVGLVPVNEVSAIDIDNPTDLQTARLAARCFR